MRRLIGDVEEAVIFHNNVHLKTARFDWTHDVNSSGITSDDFKRLLVIDARVCQKHFHFAFREKKQRSSLLHDREILFKQFGRMIKYTGLSTFGVGYAAE